MVAQQRHLAAADCWQSNAGYNLAKLHQRFVENQDNICICGVRFQDGTLGAWQVASMAYAPSKLLSSKGMLRKLPSTGSHSVARPSYGQKGKAVRSLLCSKASELLRTHRPAAN